MHIYYLVTVISLYYKFTVLSDLMQNRYDTTTYRGISSSGHRVFSWLLVSAHPYVILSCVYLLIALYLSSKLFHQNQLHSLQEYVNDLSSKNDMLLETVEDLEREANERVTLVEAKLQTTVEVVNKSPVNFVSVVYQLTHSHKDDYIIHRFICHEKMWICMPSFKNCANNICIHLFSW
jgi:hypothetical protein